MERDAIVQTAFEVRPWIADHGAVIIVDDSVRLTGQLAVRSATVDVLEHQVAWRRRPTRITVHRLHRMQAVRQTELPGWVRANLAVVLEDAFDDMAVEECQRLAFFDAVAEAGVDRLVIVQLEYLVAVVRKVERARPAQPMSVA